MALQEGAEFGPYRILGRIGQGGMANVYRAFQPSLRREVAIKVKGADLADKETFRARFRREAEVLARLEHPNILTVFDYGEADGQAYIAYRHITGGELKELLGRPMPPEEVVRLLSPVASALDFAHARGIVHRDIKPSNILLTDDRTPIVADFGLARILQAGLRSEDAPSLTETSVSIGTPAYMAPEQVLGRTVDGRCDQYALGIIAFQMLTGSILFSAETPMAVAMQQVHEPLPLPRSRSALVSPPVERVLLVVLSKNPDDRYESCGAFVAAMAAAAADSFEPSGAVMHATPQRPATVAPIAVTTQTSAAQSDSGGPSKIPTTTAPLSATSPAWRSRRVALAVAAALVAAIAVAVAALAVRGNSKHASPLATVLAEAAVATRQGSSPVPAGAPATSTNGSPVSAPSTLLVFTGRLNTDWTNSSDAKQASIELPSSVTHSGHQSVKVSTVAPYAGLSLVSPGTATGGYTHLRFYVRPDKPAALPDVYVSGEIGGHDREGAVFGSAAVTRVAGSDGWTRLEVPLVWVGLDNGSLTRLSWYTNTGQPGISFYLADIELIRLTPQRLDATQAGSVRFTASFASKPVSGVVILVSSGARLATQALGQAVFTNIPRGPLEYRVKFPDSFDGSPLVDHDDGSLVVKAGTTVDQAIAVVKSDLLVDAPNNEAVVTLPVTLRWQAYPGAAKYHVEIDPHGPGSSVERDSSQASLTVDANLPRKTLFDYRVTALDAAGNILARSEPQFFRTP